MKRKIVLLIAMILVIVSSAITFGEGEATPDPKISMNSFPIEMTLK